MSGNRDVKQLSRSLSHLLKRAVQYSIHLYMSETGKSGLTHRQFTVLLAADAHEALTARHWLISWPGSWHRVMCSAAAPRMMRAPMP